MALTNRRTFLKRAGVLATSVLLQKAARSGEPRKGQLSLGGNHSRYSPINSGPSQAEGIAGFACRTKYEELTHERRERLKVSILDSLGCAINALGARPIEACLAQATEFGGPHGRCTLIGGGQANVLYAASYNTALVRFVDFMDSFLAGAELCHPSDNVGGILAACEHAGRSGRDFLTALAVAYQVECQLTAETRFMAHGLDLTTPLAFSLAAGLSRALDLDEARTAAAVEICGDSVITFLVVRTNPISQWKGLASSQTALGCVNGVFLASRGVTGPKYVVEGPNGLAQALGQPIQIDWAGVKLDCFDRLALKSYNSAVPTQSSIHCMLELRKAHAFDPAEVEAIAAEVVQNAYDYTGGGSFGPRTDVHTTDEADHSIPYLLAVAGLDGDVQPAQLTPTRIAKPDVQELLRKVAVTPDNGFTARSPREIPSRVTVRLKSGKSFRHEVSDYPGFPTRPFTWEDSVRKFEQLAAGRVDAGLCREIKDAVRGIENIQVSDLMQLLGRVKINKPIR